MCNFPLDLEITWNYGEVHHFKGPYDSISGAVKRKVFPHVKASEVVIQRACHSAEFADEVCKLFIGLKLLM